MALYDGGSQLDLWSNLEAVPAGAGWKSPSPITRVRKLLASLSMFVVCPSHPARTSRDVQIMIGPRGQRERAALILGFGRILTVAVPAAGLAALFAGLAFANGVIAPARGQVLCVDIRYRSGAVEILRLELLSGAPQKSSPAARSEFIVRLRDAAQRSLYTRPWTPSTVIYSPPNPPGEPPGGDPPAFLTELETTLVLPYYEQATSISIERPDGRPVAVTAIRGLVLQPAVAAAAHPVWISGPDVERLVVLFLGDSYRGATRDRYESDVAAHAAFFLEQKTLKKLRNNINIYRGQTRSGLGCEYNCNGATHLICCDLNQVYRAAAAAGIEFDEIVVLVEDPRYGGSGGAIAVAYNRHGERPQGGYAWGREVLVHEFGHSWGGLLDEYLYGSDPGCCAGINCSQTPCQWKGKGVGCHPGCSYPNLNRATENGCLMKTLTPDGGYLFCPICSKHLKKLNKLY